MICPTCAWCADHGLDHLCVTRGGTLDRLSDHTVIAHETGAILDDLIEQLDAHPARPLGDWTLSDWTPSYPPSTLRRLDPTWCDCACGDGPATPTPATRKDQSA